MIIKSITPDDLRHMQGQEALILQGCGGDLLLSSVPPMFSLHGRNTFFIAEFLPPMG